MSTELKGVLAGVAFGLVSVGLMLPLPFPDKRTALTAAFLNRFAIGLVIGCVRLPSPGWLTGLAFGLLLSLPDAMITNAFVPITVIGSLGGLIIGGLLHGWRSSAG